MYLPLGEEENRKLGRLCSNVGNKFSRARKQFSQRGKKAEFQGLLQR